MAAEARGVTVIGLDGSDSGRQVLMAEVLNAPLRRDLVEFVHTNIRKNSRQAYGVQNHFGPMGIVAGHQHSAHSWGTGRAVSRIPRVSGGGTHRAGQAAFGNMCRGGRMFAPTKTYRRWHRKVNKTQRQQAVSAALSATAKTPLVMARGHSIESLKECPVVVDDQVQSLTTTKSAIQVLVDLGLAEELERCKNKKYRPGKGKMRNRRFKKKRGPLVVYAEDSGLVQAFRNIPGVDTICVDRLNLLLLAPGGHVGRLCVWSESAFNKLNEIFTGKKIPQRLMTNTSFQALINSDEIQSVIREARETSKAVPRKRNLLSNKKNRFETFRGFSLEEVQSRKRKAESMDKRKRKKFRQS